MYLLKGDIIRDLLAKTKAPDENKLGEILKKAQEGKGLDLPDVATLLMIKNAEQRERVCRLAQQVKQSIYGTRMVLFAPLYLSNDCVNSCTYCGFSLSNTKLLRKTLTLDEAVDEARFLVSQGQKRLLVVCGENQAHITPGYVAKVMEGIYKDSGIRRINVNMAPQSTEGFKVLKEAGIGTYQLFQETYHRATYDRVHQAGPKKDYLWRLSSYDRAFEAGIDDLGFGVLFGLYDYRFEVLALLQHIQSFEKKYGVGPHTISLPRWRPASGASLKEAPYPVGDDEFADIVTILRLAVPYTGIILSTREPAELRNRLFNLGVSQISAGSSTSPGGYKEKESGPGQFQIDDVRTVEEIVMELCKGGFLPSFCTACYRRERTGHDFMALAKTGAIKNLCQANAILTFREYLLDNSSPKTRTLGEVCLVGEIRKITEGSMKTLLLERLCQLNKGSRDLYF
ncbi:MAG: [FeFe] hydrogenase H-cluster radical SAM maturase HydG [Thermincolia bacterium]